MKLLLNLFNKLRQEQLLEEQDVLVAIDNRYQTVSEIAKFMSMEERRVRKVLSRLEVLKKVQKDKYIHPRTQVISVVYCRRISND